MAKSDKDRASEKDAAAAAWDAVPEALREAARRASDLSQNPYARGLLAAGLLAAAAALASNKKVQKSARRNLKAATEAAEVGAESAGKIGIAMVNAATEAVQRIMTLSAAAATGDEAKQSAAPSEAPKPAAPARRPRAAKASPKAADAKPGKPRAAPKSAAAPAKAKAAPKATKPKAAASRTTKKST